jgi:hypothetical protein
MGAEKKSVNPYALGGAFLRYCVEQGWLTQEGEGRAVKWFITERGRVELRRFGVDTDRL